MNHLNGGSGRQGRAMIAGERLKNQQAQGRSEHFARLRAGRFKVLVYPAKMVTDNAMDKRGGNIESIFYGIFNIRRVFVEYCINRRQFYLLLPGLCYKAWLDLLHRLNFQNLFFFVDANLINFFDVFVGELLHFISTFVMIIFGDELFFFKIL